MKNYYIFKAFLLIILSVEVGFGQGNAPKLTPLTPNAASLGKYGDLPVSLYTGQLGVNIPIYEIVTNDLKIPINLSYNYSGFKVEEQAGWVGLGWALNCNGVINRQLRGIEDEGFGGYYGFLKSGKRTLEMGVDLPKRLQRAGTQMLEEIDPTNPLSAAEKLYMNQLSDGDIDSEPDLFVFNYPGGSGKFFITPNVDNLEANGTTALKSVTFVPQQPIKGTANINYYTQFNLKKGAINKFTINDSKGNLYEFTSELEYFPTHEQGDTDIPNFASSWLLTKIITQNGNEIEYTYVTRVIALPPTASQNLVICLNSKGEEGSETKGLIPTINNGSANVEPTLSKITVKVGGQITQTVKFILESTDRLDWNFTSNSTYANDKPRALKEIQVLDSDNKIVKRFNLSYVYNERLMLQSVKEIFQDQQNNIYSLPAHEFNYQGVVPVYSSNTPDILLKQDHWGYYNGSVENSLIPSCLIQLVYSPNPYQFNGNDRIPSFHGSNGLLQKIKYPTGGTTEISYEPHEYYGDLETNPFNVCAGNFTEIGSINLTTRQTETRTSTFTVGSNISCMKIDYDLNAPCLEQYVDVLLVKDDGTTIQLVDNNGNLLKVGNTGPNIPIINKKKLGSVKKLLTQGNYTLTIITSYEASGSGCGKDMIGNISIKGVLPSIPGTKANFITGGFRVQKQKDCPVDGINTNCTYKEYNYKTSNVSSISTGVLAFKPVYDYINYREFSVPGNGGPQPRVTLQFQNFSGNSVIPFATTQGSHIGYSQVTVSNTNGSNLTLGKTVHKFKTSIDYPERYGESSLIPLFPFTPATNEDWKRGSEVNSMVYDNAGVILSKTESTYNNLPASEFNQKLGIKIGVHFSTPLLNPSEKWRNFAYKLYYVNTGFQFVEKESTIEYVSGNEMKNEKKYTYGNASHLQPTEIITTNSKNDEIKTNIDYLSGLYIVPIEETSSIKKAGETNWNLLSRKKTFYRTWYNKFIAPLYIQTQKTIGALQTEIVFGDNFLNPNASIEANSYDNRGNLLTYQERNGLKNTFEWYDNSDLNRINLLKSQANNKGQKTTYEYFPLIGLSKVTDPNGKYMTYEYDALNRLKSISDQNGKLKSYTYHYGSQSATDIYEVVGAAALAPVTLDCEAECRVEAYAKPIAPITNCTAGQFMLDANSSSTGTDITYRWAGPNQYVSNTKSPTISGNLTNYAGVYTLTVTRNNSNCTSTASATTEVTLDCNCPFVINTNGSSSGTLSCYQTISLVSNCQGCSTGDVAPGTETFVNNGSFSNGDVDFSCDAANRFVTTNPVNIVGSFNSFGDHTFNIPYNNMLLVGHSDNREEKVWYRSMTIKPNTRYILSAWVAGAYNNNPTKVFFELGGVSLNETVDLATKSGGQWTQLKSVWTSGDQTSIVLAIRKVNQQGHNWFCLDDISMTEAPISEFSWSGPNGFNANGKNQFVRNVALKNGGNYQLTVKDNGCVRKINVPVAVNCIACSTPFIVSTKTNSPVSCGSPITFQTSSSPGVSYEWYNLNSDGSTTPFPATEINKKNPSLSAPVVIGTNRYGYEVQARKDGCTASYTTAVEVKCEPSGNPDLSLRLFKNSAPAETVTTNEVFPICAEIKNESNQPVFSVTAKIKLPDCLTYYGSSWGLNTGGEPNTGGYYEDTWYNPATREVSNISVPNRGGNAWQYWGVPIGPNQIRYMCFYVQSSANTTILIKGEIAGMETQYHQNMRDADSTPNNGYDNGEDDRSVLKLNPLVNELEITKYQIFAPNTASTDVFDVIATNTTWTSVNSNTDWIQLNNVTGNSGTTNMVVSFTENLSAKPRYGTITFKAACGLGEVVQIRQAGRDDCPSIDVSSNNPLCGDELKLFSAIVPAANKDLVTNGNFEKGNIDFNPEAFHVYNSATGGTNAYVVSANPKSENGNTGLWFLNKECQPENTNPVCTVVNRVRLLRRTDCCFDRMNGATIQGSNNNGIWDVLHTFGNATGGWQDITLSNTKKYSYIRFVDGPNGYGELMSLEFYNGTTKLSGTPIGSAGVWGSNIPVYGFQNALDNNDGSLWHGISPGNSNYVGYELNNCGTVPDLASNAGAGKQMAVVASWRQRDYFWSQTINVDPSTNYTISAKAVLLGTYDAVPVKLIFEVDGKEVNIASDLSTYGCNWKKISGTWNSGEKFGPVKLAIRFENPNSAEKAFAIDDISVKPVQQGTTSNGAISYVWTGPVGAFSGLEARTVLPNPTLPNANAAKAGKYTLTVTQNGCPATESTDVAVGCNSTSCPAPSISTSYGVICANMNQSTTLTAVGCAVGNIVKWSDGQIGATISTGQIKNSTVYTAQCVNACGASIKSNEVTVHVLPMPNPPTILGASTIYVSPGANGITLTASGCPNGTIRWSDGSAGLMAFVPANLNLGTILTYSSRCITECGTSDKSNEVRIVVECDAVEPTTSITQFQPCTVDGGLVKMAANCPVGQAVWYDESNAKVNTGNVFEKAIFSNNETKFKVRCELTGLCISDFAWVLIPPNLKPARPYISSAPANPENPLNVSIGVNSTISISSSCPTGTVTNWNLAGYSPSNPTGKYISLTPTNAGIITATTTCTIGTCVSDVSVAMIINVAPNIGCSQSPVVVSPADVTATRTDGGYLVLTATNCLGNVTWKDEEKQLVDTKTFSLTGNVILNVPTSVVGVFKYVAECKPTNVATCPSSITRTITVIPSTCNLAVSITPTTTCSYTDLVAGVTKAGSAYANVDYQWYYRTSAGGTAYEIVNNANNFRAEDSGERWYSAKAKDKSDALCVATSADLNVKVLKPTDLPTIVSSLSVEANNLIKVNKAGTLNLTVAGCPAFSTPSWLVTDPTGVLNTTAYTGNSITLTGFLKTDDFKVKVKCVSGSSACETNYSNEFTVKVIDLNCDVTIDNFKGDATNPAKTTANGDITLNASGCSNGTITWYLGATSLGTGTSVVVNKPTGTYTFVASCSKGSGCTDQTTIEFSCAGPPILSYNAPTTKVCQGQSIQLKSAGCTGGTVTWYNGSSTLGTGEFLTTSLPKVSAKCTIGSCTSIETFIETQDDIDLQTLTIFPNCEMNELTVTPDATGNTYEWKKFSQTISGAKTNKVKIDGLGTYTVIVKNGVCTATTSYGITNANKLNPTVTVASPVVNCTAKTFTLNSSITQNTYIFPSSVSYRWTMNGEKLIDGSTMNYTVPNLGNYASTDSYEFNVYNTYLYANNTRSLQCMADAKTVVVNEVIPTPVLNANSTCVRGTDKTTLTATNCTSGKIKWFKGNVEIAGQSSLTMSEAVVGKYQAQCVGTNCTGNLSNEVEITACAAPPTGPTPCTSPFSDISGTNQLYNQTFTYANTPGSQTRNIQVTFDAYCVPDNLIIYKVTANGESVLVNSGCMGSGIVGSTNNVRTKTFPAFSIAPGETIRVTVGPVPCGQSNCQDAVTAWKVSFDCIPAN